MEDCEYSGCRELCGQATGLNSGNRGKFVGMEAGSGGRRAEGRRAEIDEGKTLLRDIENYLSSPIF